MATTDSDPDGSPPPSAYTLGPATYRKLPRVETKPSSVYADYESGGRRKVRRDTGGGYERVRSYEPDPTKPGDRKRDVYVSIHRLCAVAWLLPEDAPLSVLDGMDVHHTTGVEWANFGDSPNFEETGLELMEHGRHSEITRDQMLAWAKDAEREVERQERQPLGGVDKCDSCGAEGDVSLWTSPDFDGERCTACAMDAADGGALQEA